MMTPLTKPHALEFASRRFNIRSRISVFALGAIILINTVTFLVALDLTRIVIQRARQTSLESLRSHAEAYLIQINDNFARQNNQILEQAVKDIQSVAQAAESIYHNNPPKGFWLKEGRLLLGRDRQLINSGDDISSVFIPFTQPENEAVNRDIELSGYLILFLPAILDNNPNTAGMYFVTENNLTRYYPNNLLGQVVPPDFQMTHQPWYLTSIEANKGLAEPKPVWSAVHQSANGLGLVTTIAMPVLDSEGKRIGAVGLDLTLDEIIKNIVTARFLKTGYAFLIDGSGMAIALPSVGYRDFLRRNPVDGEATPNLGEAPDELIRETLSRMLSKGIGFESLNISDRELLLAYSTLESTGWILGSVVGASDVLQKATAIEDDLLEAARSAFFRRAIPIGIFMSLALLLIAFLLRHKLVAPIKQLAEAAERICAGEYGLEITHQQKDEIGLLARALKQLSVQIYEAHAQFEERVAERTQALQKQTVQLEAAASIASEISTANDLKKLLQQAVDLICSRFDYYLVGLFLLDEAGEYAHLRAASGELGDKLMQHGIQLRVGGQGMIGYVTQFGQARLANDVHKDETYLANPLMPDSRSEAVIPLLSSGRSVNPAPEQRAIIGALDIQSASPNAFKPDDLVFLQVLADQLVTAIENFRLVDKLQAALDELTLIHHQDVRNAWRRVISKPEGLAFEYDQTGVKPADPLRTIPGDTHNGNQMVIPIRQRGQVIGLIGLESGDPTHLWMEDEISILQAAAEQTALTIENARLVTESKKKAIQEQISREITARIRSSLDVETVIQTVLKEISSQLGIAQIEVQLDPARLSASVSDLDDGTGHHE